MSRNFYDDKNIQFWNELAEIHFDKSDYNIDSYDPLKYQLRNIEISELGSLTEKKSFIYNAILDWIVLLLKC